jgi:hypothetical protein
MSGVSGISQEYRFILNGQFLRMATISVFKPQEKNPDGKPMGTWGYSVSMERPARRQRFSSRVKLLPGSGNRSFLENIDVVLRQGSLQFDQFETGEAGVIYDLVRAFQAVISFDFNDSKPPSGLQRGGDIFQNINRFFQVAVGVGQKNQILKLWLYPGPVGLRTNRKNHGTPHPGRRP